MREFKIIKAITKFGMRFSVVFGVGMFGMFVCRASIFLHALSSTCFYLLSSLIISVPPMQGSPESETRILAYSSPWTFGLANKNHPLSVTQSVSRSYVEGD